MAASRRSPSRPPSEARSTGGEDKVTLFLETDLGTCLGMYVAADCTLQDLKSKVAMVHATSFPNLGPVSVISFQLLMKGKKFYLDDSVPVRSALTKGKERCFMHVKMEAAPTDTHRCTDAPWSEACLGVHVDRNVKELPSLMISQVASDVLPQEPEGGDATALLNNVSGNKRTRTVEETGEETHASEKESKRPRKNGSFDSSAANPIKETNKSKARDVNKYDSVPLETNADSGELLLSTSLQQELHGNIQEDSILLQNPIIPGKSKKGKKTQPVKSKEVHSAQEFTKPSSGSVEVPKAIGEGLPREDNHGLQGDSPRDDILLSSSQLISGSQGIKHVRSVSDAQATNLVSDQGNDYLVHKGYENPTIEDTSNFTSKFLAGEEESIEKTNVPCDGEDDYATKNDLVDNCVGHDEGLAEVSNMDKGGNSKKGLERIHTDVSSPQETQDKKAEEVSSVRIASIESDEEKDQYGFSEKAAKSDVPSTLGGIVNDPCKLQISSDVHQGDSDLNKNPDGDGKRRKIRRSRKESSKHDPTQDGVKSSGFIAGGVPLQNTSSDALIEKQTEPGTMEESKFGDGKKLDESFNGEENHDRKELIGNGGGHDDVVEASNMENGEKMKNGLEKIQTAGNTPHEKNRKKAKNPDGDGKRIKIRRSRKESSKHDPTQDGVKSSGFIAGGVPLQNTSSDALIEKHTEPGTMEESKFGDCKKLDESFDGEENHDRKELIGNGGGHDDVVEASNMENGEKMKNGLEKIQTAGNTPHEKKRKKAKRVSSVCKASIETADGFSEKASKSDVPSTQGEIVNDPDKLRISSALQQEDANLTKNPNGDGKRKKKGRNRKECPKDDPTQDGIKSSGLIASGISVQNTSFDARMAKKIEADTLGEWTLSGCKKLDESLDEEENHDRKEPIDNGGGHDKDVVEASNIEKGGRSTNSLEEIHTADNTSQGKKRKKAKVSSVGIASMETAEEKDCGNVEKTAKSDIICTQGENDGGHDEGVVEASNIEKGGKCKNSLEKLNAAANTSLPKKRKKAKKVSSVGIVPMETAEVKDQCENGEETAKPDVASQGENMIDPCKLQIPSILQQGDSTVIQSPTKRKKKIRRQMESSNDDPTEDAAKSSGLIKNGSVTQNAVADPLSAKETTPDTIKEATVSDCKKLDGSLDVAARNVIDDVLRDLRCTDISTKPKSSACAVESNGYVEVHADNEKINFFEHFSPTGTNDPLDSLKNRGNIEDGIIREVKGKKKSKRKPDMQSQLAKKFSMSPSASSESAESTPQNGNRYRVAVRKVPTNRYEQEVSGKSRRGNSKKGSSAIFDDAINEGSDDDDDVLDTISEKAAMEVSTDDSSISAYSGISSASQYGSDVPDDDGVSLSQKSFKEGLHIGSILRGSSSYKKARRKHTEDLDDTEVPDSQPPEDLYSLRD